MGLVKEFKEFAMRGSVIDLAVGVVIGGAFGKIVNGFVANIIMPPLNLLTASSGMNFKEAALTVKMNSPELDAAGKMVLDKDKNPIMKMQDYPIFNYGPFLQTIVEFLIIAIAIFIVIKMINKAKERMEGEKEEAKPDAPAEDIVLLREIRDSLKNNS